MQINMMCARREFKNAQQRFDHMTMVIKSYLDSEEIINKEALPYIQERKGNPFAAMMDIDSYIDGNMAGAWIFHKDLKTFKKLIKAIKTRILSIKQHLTPNNDDTLVT